MTLCLDAAFQRSSARSIRYAHLVAGDNTLPDLSGFAQIMIGGFFS